MTPIPKRQCQRQVFLIIQLIREMELTQGNFILFCFLASINEYTTLTQFWYTVKLRKVSSWTYIFQIIFLVGVCQRANAAFSLSDQVILFIAFALYRLRYKFLFFTVYFLEISVIFKTKNSLKRVQIYITARLFIILPRLIYLICQINFDDYSL